MRVQFTGTDESSSAVVLPTQNGLVMKTSGNVTASMATEASPGISALCGRAGHCTGRR